MESNLSLLSSIEDEPFYVNHHYKESYRYAIYALLCGGTKAYEEYRLAERVSSFLSEEEMRFILDNAEFMAVDDDSGGTQSTEAAIPSTYFPEASDDEVPVLELGWPTVSLEETETNISLLFHPPRKNTPSIKEVVRKQIQVAREVIAIAMDVFTDVDIFKELISAAIRGVAVYILLDDSRVGSFLKMSDSVGINIHDIKNLCLRTVKGEEYRCWSGMKFHGTLEQRFILIDCQTALFGTYGYQWSFEKLNQSMVMVTTGQLVSSFDELFRTLYACSIIPAALSSGRLLSAYPKSSQLSLNHLYMKSRPSSHMRDGFNDAAMLNRGFSVQEMLHHSHLTDTENLVRGHSYGGELPKLNSGLKMGTKNLGVPIPPGRTGSTLRHTRDVQQSQHHLKHQARYGADHNLIPFSSETSLNKWKIDTYLRDSDVPPDASCDAYSPVTSPYSSLTSLNQYQSQLIHNRSMDIRSRLEESRQKRLSLQEHDNFRQSKESLRSLYSTADRPQHKRPQQGRPRGAEMDPNTETIRHNPALAKTQSDAEIDLRLRDSTLKISNMPSDSVRHSWLLESLTEIPEEKEASNSRGDGFDTVLLDKTQVRSKEETVAQRERFKKSSSRRESYDKARESYGFIQNRIDSPPPREGNQPVHGTSAECLPSVEPQRGPTTKEHTQPERSELQRNNLMTTKGNSELTDNEKKASRKAKSLQRTALKSQNMLDSNQALQIDHPKTSALGRPTKKDQSAEMSQSLNALSGPSETEKRTEKHKSPFSKLSPQRSSKRKTTPSAEQDQGSRSTPDHEAASASQTKREKAYTRYESLISNEKLTLDKPAGLASSSDKVKSLSLNRRGDGFRSHQTQGGADNKLGRLMQRMGNLINKK
ncbi:protein FAM83B [Fundulus heteroclitus]|uniref:protein FAM83B n=1 Tax=Fundulus heteroclitus TaxID=8078 RepID=UPI00165AFA6E|nr:protein FAM83B [Fundulus heteroclitus]